MKLGVPVLQEDLRHFTTREYQPANIYKSSKFTSLVTAWATVFAETCFKVIKTKHNPLLLLQVSLTMVLSLKTT